MEQPLGLVKPSLVEDPTDAASLQRGDSVQTWGGGATSFTRAALCILHRYLDVILGAVLLLAGVLKAQQLLTDPSGGRATGFPRELLSC